VVRTSYADPFYSKLALEAIQAWKKQEVWEDAYHESGVLVLGDTDSADDYKHKAYLHDQEIGVRILPLENPAGLRQVFPPHAAVGTFETRAGYLNRDSGWANAGQGVSLLMKQVTALHGKILVGKNAIELIHQAENFKTTGVRCSDGSILEADLVVLATGSWTRSAFPDLPGGNIYQATGQCVAMIQLSQDEAELYKDCPVVLDFKTGFYIFPVKCHHVAAVPNLCTVGYTRSIQVGSTKISTPRTVVSDPETGLLIPKANVRELREGLRTVYPNLAEKPFIGTRMCWYAARYNDSFDSDWVIGFHPDSEKSLMFATGGSGMLETSRYSIAMTSEHVGHAYKFLPVIGQIAADAIEEKLSPELVAKFSPQRTRNHKDESRRDIPPEELDMSQLCTVDDLRQY
ncbi:DAO domain-containing protein, partial [Favolaschia claudopus]